MASSLEPGEEMQLRSEQIAALAAVARSKDGLTTVNLQKHTVLLDLAEISTLARTLSPSKYPRFLFDVFEAVVIQARREAPTFGTYATLTPPELRATWIAASGELLNLSDPRALFKHCGKDRYETCLRLSEGRPTGERRKQRALAWTGERYNPRTVGREVEDKWWPVFLDAVEARLSEVEAGSVQSVQAQTEPREISFTGPVLAAISAARAACAAQGRAFYTPDLLSALFDVPGGRLADCFNEVRGGLAQGFRDWLVQGIEAFTLERTHPPEDLSWDKYPDIKRAYELVEADGGAFVTEIYLLVAVLEGSSTTSQRLKSLPGLDFDRLYDIANRRRQEPAGASKSTPGMDHELEVETL